MSIYKVKVGGSTYVLVCDGAEDASRRVRTLRGDEPTDEVGYEVGRLGDYGPGMIGASMVRADGFVVIDLAPADPKRTVQGV